MSCVVSPAQQVAIRPASRGRNSSAAHRATGSMSTCDGRARRLGAVDARRDWLHAGDLLRAVASRARGLAADCRVSIRLPLLSPHVVAHRNGRRGADSAGRQKIDAAAGTPRPFSSPKCARQVSWLTARSRFRPSQGLPQWPNNLFEIGGVSLAVYSCGGSCGFAGRLRRLTAFPFHRAHARTDARQDVVFFVTGLSTSCGVAREKILEWTGLVVAGSQAL